jgi:four helix bundle protein
MANNYQDLLVWQESFGLTVKIYEICKLLPKNESFGLASQIQRSAVSIPSNIAEGQQRSSKKEFLQFLSIARGSTAELETQLLLTQKLYDLKVSVELEKTDKIQRMLAGLMKKLADPPQRKIK